MSQVNRKSFCFVTVNTKAYSIIIWKCMFEYMYNIHNTVLNNIKKILYLCQNILAKICNKI